VSLSLSIVGILLGVLLVYYVYKTFTRVMGADVSRFRIGNGGRASRYESEFYDDLFESIGACTDAYMYDPDMHKSLLLRPWVGGKWHAESPRIKALGEVCERVRGFGKGIVSVAGRSEVVRRLIDGVMRHEDLQRFPDEPKRLEALCYRVLKACVLFERDVYVWCGGFTDMPSVSAAAVEASHTLPTITEYMWAMYGTSKVRTDLLPERQLWIVDRVRGYALRERPSLAGFGMDPDPEAVSDTVARWLVDETGEEVNRYAPAFLNGGGNIDRDVLEDIAQRMWEKVKDAMPDDEPKGQAFYYMVRRIRDIANLYTGFFAALRACAADRHPVFGHYTKPVCVDTFTSDTMPKTLMLAFYELFGKAREDDVNLLAISGREWLAALLRGEQDVQRYVVAGNESPYIAALSAVASDPVPIAEKSCGVHVLASMCIARQHITMLLSDRYPPPEFFRVYQPLDYMDSWKRSFRDVAVDGYLREVVSFAQTYSYESTHYYGSLRKVNHWVVFFIKLIFNPKNFWPTTLGGNGFMGFSWGKLKGEGFAPEPLPDGEEDIIEGFTMEVVLPFLFAGTMVLFAVIMAVIGAIAGMPILDVFLAIFGPFLWFAAMGILLILIALQLLPFAIFAAMNIVPFAAFLAVILVTTVMYAAVLAVMGIVFLVDYLFYAGSGGRISFKALLGRWFSCQSLPHDWYDVANAHRGNRWSQLHFGTTPCGCMAPCGMGQVPAQSDSKVLRCEDATDNNTYSAQALLFRTYKQMQTLLPHSLDSSVAGQVRYDDIAHAVCRYGAHLDRGSAVLKKLDRLCQMRYCGGEPGSAPCFCAKHARPVPDEERVDPVAKAKHLFQRLDRRVQAALYVVFALVCLTIAIIVIGYLLLLRIDDKEAGGALASSLVPAMGLGAASPFGAVSAMLGKLMARIAAENLGFLNWLSQKWDTKRKGAKAEKGFKRAYIMGLAAMALRDIGLGDHARDFDARRAAVLKDMEKIRTDGEVGGFVWSKFNQIYEAELPEEFCKTMPGKPGSCPPPPPERVKEEEQPPTPEEAPPAADP